MQQFWARTCSVRVGIWTPFVAMATVSLLALVLPAFSAAQGYQQYMSEYAAPYQNYMQGGNGGGGDYQKYFKKCLRRHPFS